MYRNLKITYRLEDGSIDVTYGQKVSFTIGGGYIIIEYGPTSNAQIRTENVISIESDNTFYNPSF
jgi:hypothetical protein